MSDVFPGQQAVANPVVSLKPCTLFTQKTLPILVALEHIFRFFVLSSKADPTPS